MFHQHAFRNGGFRLKPDVHVFGHTHFGYDMELDGIRYLQAPLATPAERVWAGSLVTLGGFPIERKSLSSTMVVFVSDLIGLCAFSINKADTLPKPPLTRTDKFEEQLDSPVVSLHVSMHTVGCLGHVWCGHQIWALQVPIEAPGRSITRDMVDSLQSRM